LPVIFGIKVTFREKARKATSFQVTTPETALPASHALLFILIPASSKKPVRIVVKWEILRLSNELNHMPGREVSGKPSSRPGI
jgi:hypothetical protein